MYDWVHPAAAAQEPLFTAASPRTGRQVRAYAAEQPG
jgi:hypothetical protein